MKHIALLAVVAALGITSAASATVEPGVVTPVGVEAGPAVEVPVLTGRWKLFFGTKICWGQVLHLPGESQCV